MLGHKVPDSIIQELKNTGSVYTQQVEGKLEKLTTGVPVVRLYTTENPAVLSDKNRSLMEQDNIVYAQIDAEYCRCYEYFPSRYFENRPLEGRPFIHGIFDCFTLLKDWFIQEHKIDLVWNLQRPFGWWETVDSLYLKNARLAGFEPQVGLLQVGDVLLFALQGSTVNHAAIYLGNNRILHHLGGRFSCQQTLTPGLASLRKNTWRHKELW